MKLLPRLSFLLSLFLLFNKVYASPQLPDYIIYKNDTISIYNLLVEQYLQKLSPDDEKLFGLSFRNPLESSGASFNCCRGYQAIYKIENDSLFVDAIIDCRSLKSMDAKKSKENLKLLFGNKVNNGKVYVDWFDGEISFPTKSKDNEIIRWDGVFENIFLYETVLSIKKSIVVRNEEVSNYVDYPNAINRKQKDNIPKVLFEAIKKYRWEKIEEFDCSENFEIRIDKGGKIDQVKIIGYTNEETRDLMFFEKGQYSHCLKSVKNATKGLRFDIVKRKGKPIEEYYRVEIWFNEDGSIDDWTD